jgi:hypothetical protein
LKTSWKQSAFAFAFGVHSLLFKEDKIGGICSTNREKNNSCRLLVGKSEERRTLGRPRRRWVGNMKMGLGEIRWGGVGSIDLSQDRYKCKVPVNAEMNLLIP